MMVFNAQILMISSVLGLVVVAKYVVVNRFYDIVRMGIANFTLVLFPSLAAMQAEGNWVLIKKLFFKMLRRITLICIVAFIALVTIGEKAFIFWSKQNDAETHSLYQVFAIFIMLIVIDNVSAVFLSAFKLNKLQTVISIVQGLIGLVLGYVLLKIYGIVGVAAASVVALLVTNFIFNPVYLVKNINKKLGAKPV